MTLTPHYIDSVKQLRTVSRTTEVCVIAGGFWQAGDGGGGTFIWMPTKMKGEEEDGCIVIKEASGLLATPAPGK